MGVPSEKIRRSIQFAVDDLEYALKLLVEIREMTGDMDFRETYVQSALNCLKEAKV